MLDFIFEIFIEFVVEGTATGIMYFFSKIIPEEKLLPKFEKVVRVIVAIISVIVACMLFFGAVIRIVAENPEDKSLANTLLIISGSFVALLIIIRIFTPKKEKEK